MYTIKRAAELTGVPQATLRAWERRYGVVVPLRTETGYRVYDDAAVRTITLMRELVQDGWAPRQAADEVRRRGESRPAAPTTDPPTADPPAPRGPNERTDDTAALLDAAARLDGDALGHVLDRRFGAGSFESVVDDWLMPALGALGEAWADGRVTVAGEHLVAHAVQRRLAAAYEAGGGQRRGPRVVIGLPPGARHDLGVLAFATAARRAGLATAYVGADLPVADWVAAVRTQRASAVVLSAPRVADAAKVVGVVAAVRDARTGVVAAVGGRYQDRVTSPGCLVLGQRIGPAATLLAERLEALAGGQR